VQRDENDVQKDERKKLFGGILENKGSNYVQKPKTITIRDDE